MPIHLSSSLSRLPRTALCSMAEFECDDCFVGKCEFIINTMCLSNDVESEL
eukprot:m.607955 g.607955  ORF g.607955 m.607955 type:complete len:51 (+) comp22482_c0_seq12:711-863(+)